MAKKSKVIAQQRGSKFSTRNYSRCTRCGRPHGVLSKFDKLQKSKYNNEE